MCGLVIRPDCVVFVNTLIKLLYNCELFISVLCNCRLHLKFTCQVILYQIHKTSICPLLSFLALQSFWMSVKSNDLKFKIKVK